MLMTQCKLIFNKKVSIKTTVESIDTFYINCYVHQILQNARFVNNGPKEFGDFHWQTKSLLHSAH